MIDVNVIYQRVQDLASKDKGGYLSPQEFNRHLLDAQIMLYEFYFDKFEHYQQIPENMRDFVVPANLALSSSGTAALPLDFQHCIRVRYRKVVNVPGGEPTVEFIEATPIHASEVNLTLSSPVRKPSLSKRRVYFRLANSVLNVYTDVSGGQVELEYLRLPVVPFWNSTLDVANDQYNYTSSGSVQLEWQEYDQDNFTDLMLLLYGLPTRQSEVIQWASARQGMGTNIAK